MSILVLSAPMNFHRRNRMRKDVEGVRKQLEEKHKKGSIQITFLLGFTDDLDVSESINREHHSKGDILQVHAGVDNGEYSRFY